jgi:hypothetical protein
MDREAMGRAGLQGWRSKVADSVATPVAQRSALSEDQVRSAVGALFLLLSVLYLVRAIRRMAART